jgi:peptidoglycan/LPS O-acetylase OafA/YrhL
MTGSGEQRSHAYIWGLDLVRFAAAAMVVFFHLSWQQAGAAVGLDVGWVGVEIFFVISGFVIIGTAQSASPSEFAERRFARIYPAAIACALIDYGVLRIGGAVATAYGFHVMWGWRPLVSSLTLFGDYFLVSALWTLPVELAFYGLVLVVLVTRQLARAQWLAIGLIIWSALYLFPFALSMFGLIGAHVPSLDYGFANLTLLRHGCFFGVGMLIWLMLREPATPGRLAALSLGISACCAEIVGRAKELTPDYATPPDAAMLAAESTLVFLGAVFAIWLLARLNASLVLSSAARNIMRTVGLMTYPLYLLHEAVGGAVFGTARHAGIGQPLAAVAAFSASLIASFVVVKTVEPILRRRLVGLLSASASAATILTRRTA